MGLFSSISEKFLSENIGKCINVRIRDIPVEPGILLEAGNGDLIIKTEKGARVLIDLSSVVGIEEVV